MEIQDVPTSLEVVAAVQGAALLIRLRGVATYKDTAVLQECIRLIEKHSQPLVVIDLAGLEFIGSAALGALIAIKKRVGACGGQLRLAALTSAVREILTVAGLSNFFSVCGNAEEALS
jgi:anti-anti-sigma factor